MGTANWGGGFFCVTGFPLIIKIGSFKMVIFVTLVLLSSRVLDLVLILVYIWGGRYIAISREK